MAMKTLYICMSHLQRKSVQSQDRKVTWKSANCRKTSRKKLLSRMFTSSCLD